VPAPPKFLRQFFETDARHILSSIQARTLVLHVRGDALIPVAHGRYLAQNIDGAKLVELDGTDHLYWWQNSDRIAAEIETFVTGNATAAVDADRVLATVLFTDIVASTEQLADLGDRRWRELLDTHDRAVREQIAVHGGAEVKTTGDGFLAVFDGPARATRCALAISDALTDVGIQVRVGVHTGEIERRFEDISGFAVHLAARIMSTAEPGEVLVSRTVVDLVAGSGLRFDDSGEHSLKGLPGHWNLYSVRG